MTVSGSRGGDGFRGESATGRRPLDREQEGRLLYLYIRQRDRLIEMARRALPVHERDCADGVVQDVFAEAVGRCAAASSFLPDEGWLWRRVRSRITDRWRLSSRTRRSEPRSTPDADDSPGLLAPVERPASLDEATAAPVTVQELLATVPVPTDRAALQLRIEGLPDADIARLLQLDSRSRQVRDRLAWARWQVAAELAASSARADGAGRSARLEGPAA